ncbi:MAG: MBL fold metallo-hydrolase [Mangrovicoccus sp.]
MTKLTRRQALASTAIAGLTPSIAFAAADMLGAATPSFSRFKLGNFEVTTLLAGSATREDPQGIFGMNVSAEEFAEVSAANFIPTDAAQFFFTPTLINTGSELILFDTGLNAAGITKAIEAAGYGADQVDHVVITHMHGDHIGGLMNEDDPTFANAAYITGATEDNHWAQAGSDGYNAKVAPLKDKFSFIDPGASIVSGITSVEAHGHTPGHMGYMVESDGQQLMLIADTANHYVWSLGYPDWEVRFDMDKQAAAATRRKVLGMLAADRIPMIGYHMPFPALGFVAPRGEGYEYVPASYQMMLG